MDGARAGADAAVGKGKRAKKGSVPPPPQQQSAGAGRTINPRFVYSLAISGAGEVAIALGDGVLAFAEARTLRSVGEVEVCGGLLAACCEPSRNCHPLMLLLCLVRALHACSHEAIVARQLLHACSRRTAWQASDCSTTDGTSCEPHVRTGSRLHGGGRRRGRRGGCVRVDMASPPRRAPVGVPREDAHGGRGELSRLGPGGRCWWGHCVRHSRQRRRSVGVRRRMSRNFIAEPLARVGPACADMHARA